MGSGADRWVQLNNEQPCIHTEGPFVSLFSQKQEPHAKKNKFAEAFKKIFCGGYLKSLNQSFFEFEGKSGSGDYKEQLGLQIWRSGDPTLIPVIRR